MNNCKICGKSVEELDEPCETCGRDYIIEAETYPQELNFNLEEEDPLPEKEDDFSDYGC